MLLEDSCLSLEDSIPTDFYSHMLCGWLFSTMMLMVGEPGVELKPHALQGTLAVEMTLHILS